MNKSLVIGITAGDINGIGPEVALRAMHACGNRNVKLVLIGSAPVLKKITKRARLSETESFIGSLPTRAELPRRAIWDPIPDVIPAYQPGRCRTDASRAAAEWIRVAAEMCLDDRLDAMVTAPISKEGFQAAGINVPGHTEMLAKITGARRFAMMLFGRQLRVTLVTRHIPLSRVAKALNPEKISEAIELTAFALPWLGARRARIAVCGVNPHAGDGGKIGREEIEIIEPVVKQCRARGIHVIGPLPADSVFYRAIHSEFDAVVAMYHDQGLAPLKMIAFDSGVNVTLGLPIVRTSPDHGTAYELAGSFRASPASMSAAIKWAIKLAQRPNPWNQ